LTLLMLRGLLLLGVIVLLHTCLLLGCAACIESALRGAHGSKDYARARWTPPTRSVRCSGASLLVLASREALAAALAGSLITIHVCLRMRPAPVQHSHGRKCVPLLTVCRSVNTPLICENLPPKAALVSRHQEMLSHADTHIFALTLQRRGSSPRLVGQCMHVLAPTISPLHRQRL
jgi:hypothetical protein